jgi:hypothetical protein
LSCKLAQAPKTNKKKKLKKKSEKGENPKKKKKLGESDVKNGTEGKWNGKKKNKVG